MSRHARIVQDLHDLKEAGVILSFQRDSYENEPTRVMWFVLIDTSNTYQMSTTEVEAFIIGAKKALTIRKG
jgi:hypothetical protein